MRNGMNEAPQADPPMLIAVPVSELFTTPGTRAPMMTTIPRRAKRAPHPRQPKPAIRIGEAYYGSMTVPSSHSAVTVSRVSGA